MLTRGYGLIAGALQGTRWLTSARTSPTSLWVDFVATELPPSLPPGDVHAPVAWGQLDWGLACTSARTSPTPFLFFLIGWLGGHGLALDWGWV